MTGLPYAACVLSNPQSRYLTAGYSVIDKLQFELPEMDLL